MPFLPPNQKRQSTEGRNTFTILTVTVINHDELNVFCKTEDEQTEHSK